MNWTTFQTYSMPADKAFEALCNQLFENWCKEKYSSDVVSFSVVNGNGGDGGVESYAVLSDKSVIGLQAKWFPYSISKSQFNQIKNSIKTAMKVRPEISRYIVCVPRDLTSKTAKSGNAEDARWNKMLDDVHNEFPALVVELWNETRLFVELQKPSNDGIYKFWFKNAEISEDLVKYAFDRAKSRWLNAQYVSQLNVYGKIERTISTFLGHIKHRKQYVEKLSKACKLCEQYQNAANTLISICTNEDNELKYILTGTSKQLELVYNISVKIKNWLVQEVAFEDVIEINNFNIDFDALIEQFYRNKKTFRHHVCFCEVIKTLRQLSKFDFYELIQEVEASRNKKSLLFLGNPGTGKTQGVGAVSEKLFSEGLHIPLLIRARDIDDNHTWRDIIVNYLELSSEWSGEELWQALSSMANRHRFKEEYLNMEFKIHPKVLIIVDGIDESSKPTKWIERIKETKAIVTKFPQVRFCFTSRPAAIPKEVDYTKVERINSNGDVPTYKLFDSYMHEFNITVQNHKWIKSVLTTPLTLKLFCELNRNKAVSPSDFITISMESLWQKKIKNIEEEYSEKIKDSPRNQHILRAINHVSEMLINTTKLEREALLSSFVQKLNITAIQAEHILMYLENYGVLDCYCKDGTGIDPNTYYYHAGAQGYFDCAAAMMLLNKYKRPENIDFNNCKTVHSNTLNALAVLSIQNYNYFITQNPTIDVVLNDWEKLDLQFMILRHTNHSYSQQFVGLCLESMADCADRLITIANKLILPLSRDVKHPLGVPLLNKFLKGFEKPAQRDILWSIPDYLRDASDKHCYRSEAFELKNEEYVLNENDVCDGCPTVYAWALSTVDNTLRKLYRSRLMTWAKLAPEEFYKLFLKFSDVNDPQIKSDLFSILMCLVYDGADSKLIKRISQWVLENILSAGKIDDHRDISLRYYAIAIIYKGADVGVLNREKIKNYLPPYNVKGNKISLNKDALNIASINGYSAIGYNLARYVLYEHFKFKFPNYGDSTDNQFSKLINIIISEQLGCEEISIEQFIVSIAYAFIQEMGWNEKEFYNLKSSVADKEIIGGIDGSILRMYSPATNGAKSLVMTVCEKYIWQARNMIGGFLSDRLLFGNDAIKITDYSLMDSFVIPSQELHPFISDDTLEDRPLYTPESVEVIFERVDNCSNHTITNVLNMPLTDWKKWIIVDNADRKFKIDSDSLFTLNMYSCYYSSADVKTELFINSILIDTRDVTGFIHALIKKGEQSEHIVNPSSWYGAICGSSSITPKEICWFPWKMRYDSPNVQEFPQFKIFSAVDKCYQNSSGHGDIFPSMSIRQLLEITDSDGYVFSDKNKRTMVEYSVAGEEWETYQTYLLADKQTLLNQLKKKGLSTIWIMRKRHYISRNASEKYEDFATDEIKSYIGYFKDSNLVVTEVKSTEPR